MKFIQFSNYLSLILIIITIVLSIISLGDSIVCPDSHRKCEIDTTCCKLSSGSYGCCPLPSAQCCSDGLHCCPNGTKCNDKEGTCDEDIPQHKHKHINQYIGNDINFKSNDLCPDKNQTCDEYETCCKEKSGGYGCCPYKTGVCCTDRLHCCPKGTQCDLIHKQCIRQSINSYKLNRIHSNERMKLIVKSVENMINDIICPGGQYQCPDFNTCCKTGQQEWGCCPLVNAICCEDRAHCCPTNTKCTQTGCQSL